MRYTQAQKYRVTHTDTEKSEMKSTHTLEETTEVQVRIVLKKVQKQGRDVNTRRLSCCRKVLVKKDWKTTLLLLQNVSQATDRSSAVGSLV